MILDRIGLRWLLALTVLLPAILVVSVTGVLIARLSADVHEAGERQDAVEQAGTLGSLRAAMLAEFAIHDSTTDPDLEYGGPLASNDGETIEIRNTVDEIWLEAFELDLEPELTTSLSELYADLLDLRERLAETEASMTDEVAVLRDRSNEVLDPWASDRLLRQGGDAAAFVVYQDFLASSAEEWRQGARLATSGVRNPDRYRAYQVQTATTDAQLTVLTRSLDEIGNDLASIVAESAAFSVRRLVDELPETGEPQPITPVDAAALVTRRTADNQAIAANMARVSTRIIDEARADGIAARRQRTTVVGAVGAGLIGAAAVALLIAARLSWRIGRLASVAEAVSSGRLNSARINDRGTDGIAVLARAMDRMSSTLGLIQAQLSALGDGRCHALVLDDEVPGPVGRDLRSAIDRVRRNNEGAIDHAETDPLTGLRNRRSVEKFVDLRDGEVGVILIDLDGFKGVDDTLGHTVGDDVLRAAADRMRPAFGEHHALARLDGGEFVAVADASDATVLQSIVDRLAESLAEPVSTPSGSVSVVASIGAVVTEPGELFESAYERAGRKMDEARRRHADGAARTLGNDATNV